MLIRIMAAAACIALGTLPLAAETTARDGAVPQYDHILVMIEENRGYRSILDGTDAPNVARLAKTYGSATQMFAERHPSEPNYVALLGGDTFGIADDDGWFCTPGSTQTGCKGSDAPDFPAHLIAGANLATQLRAKGLAWRAYLENLPAPGSLAMLSAATATEPAGLYAAKHTGFTNFASVHGDADLARELVGFDTLDADLKAGNIPAFTLIVPNQCNEMHGVGGPLSPADCRSGDGPLIARGDRYVQRIVNALLASPIWTDPHAKTALIITWDEDSKNDRLPGMPQSCCVVDAHNPGGGRIPTIVLTNHGPRGMSDPTPYDHYSLLRTIEDALRLDGHLRHADDPAVLPMAPLFGPTKG